MSLEDLPIRFWSKVDIRSEEECWPWKAAISKSGRGSISVSKKLKLQAHRVCYNLSFPEHKMEGSDVLHTCDNPICCNPKHLYLGSHQQNMKDASERGRQRVPRPGNGVTKIDPSLHKEIVEKFNNGMNQTQLALEYGCTPPNIRYILKKYGYEPKSRAAGK